MSVLGERTLTSGIENPRFVIRKQRDGQANQEMPLEPTEVVLGVDEDGDEITAIALSFGALREAKVERKLSPNDELLRQAFNHVTQGDGLRLCCRRWRTVTAVYEEDLREVFYECPPRGRGHAGPTADTSGQQLWSRTQAVGGDQGASAELT